MILVCPKCGVTVEVLEGAKAWCTHGKDETRFNTRTKMVEVTE